MKDADDSFLDETDSMTQSERLRLQAATIYHRARVRRPVPLPSGPTALKDLLPFLLARYVAKPHRKEVA